MAIAHISAINVGLLYTGGIIQNNKKYISKLQSAL